MTLSCVAGRDETKPLCLTAQQELWFCSSMHAKYNFSTSPLDGGPMKSQIQWFQWVRPPLIRHHFLDTVLPDIGSLMRPSSISSCVCCWSMDIFIQWKEINKNDITNYLVILRKMFHFPLPPMSLCYWTSFPWTC